MPAAARSQLAGCALLAALLLGGCGSGGPGRAGTAAPAAASEAGAGGARGSASRQEKQREKSPGADPCQGRLGSFVAAMDSLRRRLAVGVTFDQYLAEVRGIHAIYRRIPIERVEIVCLSAVGTAAEQAFNRYIEAADHWGECVSEAGCTSETVEPILQRRWRIASRFLSEADEGLDASAP
ncbi:MAG TPA: hypothetical protein VFN85_11580 [Solirubrobacterales bacterium]|nr:hypothetical protein [Solirubrobacterales bacterium]